MVKDETELAPLEEHILACEWCADRADEAQDYVDACGFERSCLGEEREAFIRSGQQGRHSPHLSLSPVPKKTRVRGRSET